MTRILQGFAFLCGATNFKYEKKNENTSGRSSKMTPLCKWPISVDSQEIGQWELKSWSPKENALIYKQILPPTL